MSNKYPNAIRCKPASVSIHHLVSMKCQKKKQSEAIGEILLFMFEGKEGTRSPRAQIAIL